MQLNDKAIRALKPRPKPYKVTDGRGLYLYVTPQGSRLWRFDYRQNGKRLTLSFGPYPDLGLAAAREKLGEARAALAEGRDPAASKTRLRAANDNFGHLTDEWLEKRKKEGLAPATMTKLTWFIDMIRDELGKLPIEDVGTAELLTFLRKFEAREKYHLAKRLRATLSRIFKYGIASGRAGRDPAADLTDALTSVPTTSRAAITTEKELAGLLRAVAEYDGSKHIRIALLLLVHLFCRPGELRQMEWVEIDDAKKLWLIPASRMKMRKAHVVPLSARSLALIDELRPMTGAGRFSFPSLRSPGKPISENTLNATLRRLGYTKEEVCSHGFRSTASTLLNESGRFNPDAIEAQLAHRPQGGAVRAAYLRGEFFEERVQMMTWWSDYLAGLASVV
ncbi:MAG: integrase arm-type DNA-binding domain-containing protein [Rhodomicrobium sp.]